MTTLCKLGEMLATERILQAFQTGRRFCTMIELVALLSRSRESPARQPNKLRTARLKPLQEAIGLGHSRRFGRTTETSGLPLRTDIVN